MLKTEKSLIVEEIANMLREVQRFHEQDILNTYSASSTADIRDVRLATWEAREIVRKEDGIVFCRVRSNAGLYERGSPGQIAEQARNQKRAGLRKIQRGADKLGLAALLEPDNATRNRLEKEAEREMLRTALMSRRKV